MRASARWRRSSQPPGSTAPASCSSAPPWPRRRARRPRRPSRRRALPVADLAAAREDLGRAIMVVYERLAAGRLEAADLVDERTVVKPTPRRYIRHVVGERSVYEDDARIIGRFPAALGTILDIGA